MDWGLTGFLSSGASGAIASRVDQAASLQVSVRTPEASNSRTSVYNSRAYPGGPLKKLILFLPLLLLVFVLTGAQCPHEKDKYRITFVNADPDSDGLDAVAKARLGDTEETQLAVGR